MVGGGWWVTRVGGVGEAIVRFNFSFLNCVSVYRNSHDIKHIMSEIPQQTNADSQKTPVSEHLSNFNRTALELVQDLKSVYPALEAKLDAFIVEFYNATEQEPSKSQKYITYYLQTVYSVKSLDELKGVELLKGVDTHFVFTEASEAQNAQVVWKYVEALSVFAKRWYESVSSFENIAQEMESLGFNEEFFKEQTQKLFAMLSEHEKATVAETGNSEADASTPLPPPPSPAEFEKLTDGLFGGMIGSLAKEIASEIDPNALGNPQDLLSGLLNAGSGAGEGGSNNIMNLVQNVSSKLQSKLSSGQIDQQALFNEASSLMNNFQTMPMFSEIAKTMGGGAGAGAGMPDPKMMAGLMSSLAGSMGGGAGSGGIDPNFLTGLMAGMGGGGMGGSNTSSKNTTSTKSKNLSLLPPNHPKRKGHK